MATLQIDFTAPTPVPANGFVVKYRQVGTTPYTTVFPNPTSSPVIITIPSGTSYEGTIKSDCGNSSTSPEFSFIAYGSVAINVPVGITVTATCSNVNPPVSYISNAYSDIAPGVTVYTDQALTNVLAGPLYIMNSFGVVFNILDGVVGASTGTVCGTATP